MSRPFYGEFAWAYDFVVPRPVERRCACVARLFERGGVGPPSRVLDAGCGSGGYSIGLARLGYVVTGLDLSAELLAEAERRVAAEAVAPPAAFVRGDILSPPAAPPYDAVLCRGVLNDLVDDASRARAFDSFAASLRAGGVIALDVREWRGTVRRKAREPFAETIVETPRGTLTFRSETRLDHARRSLHVFERHALRDARGEIAAADFHFLMRCWTREELKGQLARAGFVELGYLGDYDEKVPAGATDRLVAFARRGSGG
ncbi:MAG TPA: class I SAM-dependent methyltransferase [Pyrinomonadaceae bacterium]|jgi:SAM-dependent methyltransferase|nr:class I SAM-dependent methyltransferase [Pyrinomonadaceae bacterium]